MGERERLMSVREVAEYIGLPVKSIYGLNSKGTGPRRIRVGRYIRYRRSDVDAWLEDRAEPAVREGD